VNAVRVQEERERERKKRERERERGRETSFSNLPRGKMHNHIISHTTWFKGGQNKFEVPRGSVNLLKELQARA